MYILIFAVKILLMVPLDTTYYMKVQETVSKMFGINKKHDRIIINIKSTGITILISSEVNEWKLLIKIRRLATQRERERAGTMGWLLH